MATKLKSETPALNAWVRLLRGHAATVKALNAELMRDHGLTINDYEALLLLANAPDRRLRRTDLVNTLQLTASGVTRMLDGLEAEDYVCKDVCESDARVTYAVLTEAGHKKLEQASRSHLAAIEEVFAERYSRDEVETFAELLERLPGAAGATCRAAE